MANTKPVVDNLDTLEYVLNKGSQTGIHILSAAAITKGLGGEELVDMQALAPQARQALQMTESL